MKIAVPSFGDNLKASVNPSLGRAKRFIIIDSETREFEVMENPAVNVTGGAGIKAAQTIADSGAEALITFQCGQNAEGVLRAAGIKIYEAVTGSIAEVIDKFMDGQLKELKDIHPGFHGGR